MTGDFHRQPSNGHTPTPWLQGERANFRIVSEGDYTIATVGCDSSLRDQWEANAAFIVEAVNSHAALVKALETIQQFGSDTLSGRADGPDDREWQREAVREMTARATAALSHRSAKPKDEFHA